MSCVCKIACEFRSIQSCYLYYICKHNLLIELTHRHIFNMQSALLLFDDVALRIVPAHSRRVATCADHNVRVVHIVHHLRGGRTESQFAMVICVAETFWEKKSWKI